MQWHKHYWKCKETQPKQQINNCSNGTIIANRLSKLLCSVETNDNDQSIPEEVNVHIDWGGQSNKPLSTYPTNIFQKVTYHLFIGSLNIGGKVTPDSVIHGYTEIKLDGNIIRSHPRYSNIGAWYDWYVLGGKILNKVLLPR